MLLECRPASGRRLGGFEDHPISAGVGRVHSCEAKHSEFTNGDGQRYLLIDAIVADFGGGGR